MNNLREISTREDVEFLVDRFYSKALEDEVIGIFFNEIVELNWDHHLPVIYNFWDSVLFASGNYRGNPMIKHIELSKMKKMEPHHFDRWLKLWRRTIDENFRGEKAEEAYKKAEMMAKLMLFKIEHSQHKGFIQ